MNIYAPDNGNYSHNPPAEVAHMQLLERSREQAAVRSNPFDIVTEETRTRIIQNDGKDKKPPPAIPSNAGTGIGPAITENGNGFHVNGRNFVVKRIDIPERRSNIAIKTGQNENSIERTQKLDLEARKLRAEVLELARQMRDCYGELSGLSAAELSTESRKNDRRVIKEKKWALQEKIDQYTTRLEILKQHSPVIRAFVEGKIRSFLQRAQRNASVGYQLLQKRKRQLTELLKSRDIHGKAAGEAMAELAEIDRKLGSDQEKSEHKKNRRTKGMNTLRMRKELNALKRAVQETRRRLAPFTWFELERKKVIGKKQDISAEKLARAKMAGKGEKIRRDTLRQGKMADSIGDKETPKIVEKIMAPFAKDWDIENEEGDNRFYGRMDDKEYQNEIWETEKDKLENRYADEIQSKPKYPYKLNNKYYQDLEERYVAMAAAMAKEKEIQELDQSITDPDRAATENILNREEKIGETMKRRAQDIKNARRLERLEQLQAGFAGRIQRALESKRDPRHQWKIS